MYRGRWGGMRELGAGVLVCVVDDCLAEHVARWQAVVLGRPRSAALGCVQCAPPVHSTGIYARRLQLHTHTRTQIHSYNLTVAGFRHFCSAAGRKPVAII